MMDKGSQTCLVILRLPEGGYGVTRDPRSTGYGEWIFGSESVDKTLAFIRDAITPVQGPAPEILTEAEALARIAKPGTISVRS